MKLKNKLSFTKLEDNAKLSYLGKRAYGFSLPAGHSCPAASTCLTKAIEKDGKVFRQGGINQDIVCFAAVQELRFKNVRENRWHNFNILKKCKKVNEFIEVISTSLPKADYIRWHISGDFWRREYLQAVMIVAELNPWINFYAYTKSINYLKDVFIPNNFKLTLSYGSKFDKLIPTLDIKHVKVFYSEEDAKKEGYKLDHDDSLAYKGEENFGLLIHGQQRSGTTASKAIQALKQQGIFGYSKKNKYV